MYIWVLGLDAEDTRAEELMASCSELLSAEERLRAERFMFSKDRNRYLVAHALCRLMLSHYGNVRPQEWVFDKEEKGRPFIEADTAQFTLDFNISHTLGMVGCAVSEEGRVGLDLEPKERDANLKALAGKQFSVMEQQQFACAPESEKAHKFFKFWTLKEAYIKVTGKGLSENLSGFGFDLTHDTPKCYVSTKPLLGYQFGLFDAGDRHQGARAYQGNRETVIPQLRPFTLESFKALF